MTSKARSRRFLCARAATAVTAALALAGCGLAQGDDSAVGGQVTYWHAFTGGAEGAGMTEIIEAFNEESDEYEVRERPISNEEHFTVVRTGLAGGTPPDLVAFEGYQQTRDFAAADQLMDLTEFWEEHEDDFILDDSAERACTYEGRVYCIPYTFHTGWQMYYNTELLDEHGIDPPATYEEFLDSAAILKDAGVTPIAIGAKDGWPAMHWWMAFLVQRCGVSGVYDAINDDGAKFTDECFVAAADDLAQLAEAGYFSEGAASDDYGASLAVFRSGQAAFFHTGSWFAAGLLDEPTDFETGMVPFPRAAHDQHPDDIIGAVTHVIGISANATRPEGALEFLEYAIGDGATEIWAGNGLFSLVNGAFEQHGPEEVKPLWEAVLQADDSLAWVENELPPGVGEDRVYNGTTEIVAGRMDAQEFAESVQSGLDATR